WVHSALAMTRRGRLQLSRVAHWNSLKRRAAWPLLLLSTSAAASSVAISPTRRRFLARPNRKSTPLRSHHRISASRANPESPRSTMPTSGQRARICATMRDRAGRGVDVGRPLFGRQEMRATKDVQRQIAVAVVIAVKETPFLMPVQRVVGGVKIENDL